MPLSLQHDSARVLQVLERLGERDHAWRAQWRVRNFSQGEQAQLFTAHRDGAQKSRPVIIKLFKDHSVADLLAFESERSGLELISDLLSGAACGDWNLCAPALYHASEDPLALVMSSVPGIPLDDWLRTRVLSNAERNSLAKAILHALQLIWDQETIYGDLNLKNILCDPATSSLGFLDPGLPRTLFDCEAVPKDWYPMSRDLAYLNYSVAVSVKRTVTNPAARSRGQALATRVLQEYVTSLDSSDRKHSLLDEVQSCIDVHVQDLNSSWTPSGIWRRFVKQITQHNLSKMLEQMKPLADQGDA